MKSIEVKLHELHSFVRPNGHSSTPMDVDEASELTGKQQSIFARINQVDPNSPASSAVSNRPFIVQFAVNLLNFICIAL
jgi:hypothetical protein